MSDVDVFFSSHTKSKKMVTVNNKLFLSSSVFISFLVLVFATSVSSTPVPTRQPTTAAPTTLTPTNLPTTQPTLSPTGTPPNLALWLGLLPVWMILGVLVVVILGFVFKRARDDYKLLTKNQIYGV